MSYDPAIGNALGVTTAQSSSASASSKTAATPGQLTQEDFLKMLVAQMQYQNPLQPQDASKFMEQISQMSQIQGMQDMQKTFQSMVSSMNANQVVQASALIGRSVAAPGTSGNLLPGQPFTGQVVLPQSTESLQVKILDSTGTVVKTVNMGSQSMGTEGFTWDGIKDDGTPAAAGAYTVKAEAIIDGAPVQQETRIGAVIDSVTVDKSSVALNLQDGRQVSLNDISEIF